jgi:hypothetical protein
MSSDYSVYAGEMYSSHCYKFSIVTALQTKVVHRLLLPDCEAKIKYWQGFQESVFNGLLDQELDKEWFTLNCYANSQNNTHWSTDNHHALHEVPLHDLKVGFGVQLVNCETQWKKMCMNNHYSSEELQETCLEDKVFTLRLFYKLQYIKR